MQYRQWVQAVAAFLTYASAAVRSLPEARNFG
jgi:hypothetical protein